MTDLAQTPRTILRQMQVVDFAVAAWLIIAWSTCVYAVYLVLRYA